MSTEGMKPSNQLQVHVDLPVYRDAYRPCYLDIEISFISQVFIKYIIVLVNYSYRSKPTSRALISQQVTSKTKAQTQYMY